MSNATAQIDSTIEVVTPENIAFRYQAAGPFRRLPAYLLDLSVRGLAMFLLGCFGSLLFAAVGGLFFMTLLIIWFLQSWFYGGLFETFMNGQTPGKRMLGIRVVSVDGQPINALQAVLRNVLRTVDMFPIVSLQMLSPFLEWRLGEDAMGIYMIPIPTFLLGLGVMMISPRFQRLGDLVCGTMVVVDERQWLTGVARLEDPRTTQLAELLPTDFRVTPSLARALAMYADRRRFFPPARRREVARHLAEPLLEQFGLPPDTSYDLLLCALYYRTFIADRPQDGPPRERLEKASLETTAATS